MKFTNVLREKIARSAANLAIDKIRNQANALAEELVLMIEQASLEALTDQEDKKLAIQCPRYFFSPKCLYSITVDTNEMRMTPSLFPHLPHSVPVVSVFTKEETIGRMVQELVVQRKTQESLYVKVNKDTYAALCRFSTLKQCRDAWPEMASLLPEETPAPSRSLPVLRSQIDALNCLIPLPPLR